MKKVLFLLILLSVSFCKVEAQEESYALKELAQSLHGATAIDPKTLAEQLENLAARLEKEQVVYAIPALKHAIKSLATPNAALLYRDVVEAWFFTAPEEALAFLFATTLSGMNKVQTNQAPPQIAAKDYDLLLQLLSLLIDKNGASILSQVYRDLYTDKSWFTNSPKDDFIFFKSSLMLEWLQTILLVRASSLDAIAKSIHFQTTFQQKFMSLAPFHSHAHYQGSMKLLSGMQHLMALQVLKGLESQKPQTAELKKLEAIMREVAEYAPTQYKHPLAQKVLLELFKATSRLLPEK